MVKLTACNSRQSWPQKSSEKPGQIVTGSERKDEYIKKYGKA